MSNTAQFAVIVKGIDDNFKTNDELLSQHLMKEPTQGTDLVQSLMEMLNKFNPEDKNYYYPLITGTNKGVLVLVQKSKGNNALMYFLI